MFKRWWVDIETSNKMTFIDEEQKAIDELSQPLSAKTPKGQAIINAMIPNGVPIVAHNNPFNVSYPPQRWSPQDQDKLNAYEQERMVRTRELKLQHFIKMPQSMRQDLIDSLVFFDSLNKMNQDEAGYTNEHQDLINKSNSVHGRNVSFHGSPYPEGMVVQVNGPVKGFIEAHFHPYNACQLTLEHLIKAHTDQTMEEVVLTPDKP